MRPRSSANPPIAPSTLPPLSTPFASLAISPNLRVDIADYADSRHQIVQLQEADTASRNGFVYIDLVSRVRNPLAFGRRCIRAGCVAHRANIPDILALRALPSGRIAALGAQRISDSGH